MESTKNREELFWAAGFYEGEGTCCACKTDVGVYTQVAIFQNNREPLDRFQRVFEVGNTTAVDKGFKWKVSGRKAANVVKELYPLLSLRRKDQIDKTLSEITPYKHAVIVERDEKGRIVRTGRMSSGKQEE